MRRPPTGVHPAAAARPRRDGARAVCGRRLRAAVRAAPRMDAARIRSRALVGSARPACSCAAWPASLSLRGGPQWRHAGYPTVLTNRSPWTDQRRWAGRGGPAAPRSCARAPPAPRRSRPCLSARRRQQMTSAVGAGWRPGAGRGWREGGGMGGEGRGGAGAAGACRSGGGPSGPCTARPRARPPPRRPPRRTTAQPNRRGVTYRTYSGPGRAPSTPVSTPVSTPGAPS